ncbi:MAG: hypothetical protein BGO03_06355 [Mesorhizobium sp. 61-13]|nr:MAG: hypothetical protein BGO03_06355 [Mesorhizobium sp. 61-13]
MAFAAAALVLVGLARTEQLWWSQPGRFPQAPVVVLGSSLMLHAFPEQGPAKWPIDDRRNYVRFAVNSMDEQQTLDLLDLVTKRPTEMVLVEINPIAFDFAFERQTQEAWASWVLAPFNELRRFSIQTRRGLKIVVGAFGGTGAPIQQMMATAPPDQPFRIETDVLAKAYPLSLRSPREAPRLRRIIAKAREAGIEIVFVVPPRSASAESYMGKEAGVEAQKHFAALAQDFGVRLFQPAFAWPDRFFNDQAHLNRAGALRFQEELADWWRQRQ